MARTLGSLLIIGALAACGSASSGEPAPVAAQDPAGVYDLGLRLGGESRTGVMTLRREAEGYGGTIRLVGETGDARVRSLTRDADGTMILELDTPDGPATMELTLRAETIEGLLFLGSNVIDVTGTRRGR